MRIFGIDENEVVRLVRGVTASELDRASIVERFARGAWSTITEPGERVAGIVISLLGAPTALAAVYGGWSRDRLAAVIREAVPGAEVELAELGQAIARWKPRASSDLAVRGFAQAARLGARLLVPGDENWPGGFHDLGPSAPVALWQRGADYAMAALERGFALVGSRAATGYGSRVALEAASGLADRGYTIVSGAAAGIDGTSHRAALASDAVTVAFLAGGVDQLYPASNDELLHEIIRRGAVLSEAPCGTPPTRWRFLQRNRLIAAASLATVVVEAGWRSGTINTAGHAATIGRPLGAVPGPVDSPASAGCHRLIREYDAVCVTNPDEMAELAPLDGSLFSLSEGRGDAAGASARLEVSPEVTRLLDAMSTRSVRSTLDIAARAGLSVAHVQTLLGTLELEGSVVDRPGGWLRRE